MDLDILSLLYSLGYKRYSLTSSFVRSTLSCIEANISNKVEDPFIYTFLNEKGDRFYMWSLIFNVLTSSSSSNKQFLEDIINFNSHNLFINEDSFLIPEPQNINDIYIYFGRNTFKRAPISVIESRQDLGDKVFVISNAGILFSFYELIENSLINPLGIDGHNVKWIKEKTLIGTLEHSFEISPNHLIPADSRF